MFRSAPSVRRAASGSASRKSARNADGARKPSRAKSSRSAGEASHAAWTRARSSGRGSALPDEHEVGDAVGVPHRRRRERGAERADDHLEVLGPDRVAVHPLHHHAARGQPRARQRVELRGEQRGDAADPRVGRLRDDDVPPPVGRHQHVAGIADGEVDAPVAQHRPVLALEERGGVDHGRLDLDDVDALDRMGGDGADGDAAAEPDDQHAARVGVQQERQVTEHELHVHVDAVAGVGLAVHPQRGRRALAVHADGGGQPVPVEEELAVGGGLGDTALPGEALVLPGVDRRPGRHHRRVPRAHPHEAGHDHEGQRERPQPLPLRHRATADPDEDETEHEVEADRDLHRALGADDRHQGEARDHGAHDRAQGVERVEPADVAAHAGRPPRDHLDGAREPGADEQRGHQHRGHGQGDLDQQHEARGHRHGEGAHDEVGQPLEQRQDAEGGEAGAELQEAEGGGAEPPGAEQPREERAAEREPEQEGQQHGGERVGGAADHQAQRPRPRDLVHHGRSTGHREARRGQRRRRARRLQLGGVVDVGNRRLGGRGGGDVAVGEDDQRTDGDIDGGGQEQRGPHAERGQQQVAGQPGADHRAQRVQRVEEAHAAAEGARLGGEHATEDGQRRAHQRRRRQEQDEDQRELGQAEREERQPQPAGQRAVGRLHPRQQHRDQQAEEPHADLEHAVEAQGPGLPIGEAAEDPAAQPESGHEGRQHGGHGKHGVAEDETEHADPQHLVHEAGGTRQEEAGNDAGEQRPGRRRGHATRAPAAPGERRARG